MSEFSERPWAIPLTFIVALMLTIIPMPDWAQSFRPEWVAMTLIYWSMALPRRVGVGIGWGMGILLDVTQGALLGQHALGFALLAYLSVRLHQRIRIFPPWQQAISIGAMLAIYMLLMLWIYGITGEAPGSWLYWGPLLTSMILWPWIFAILRDIRRHCHLS